MLDFGMGPQEAVTAPRADASGATTQVDSRIDPETVERLRRMGHDVEVIPDMAAWYSFARPSAVMVDRERGVLRSGSDPAPVPEARGY